MNDHLHECPHPDCRRNIPLAFYACGPHWKQLPSNIRSYISRAWAGVKHGVAGALHEHDRAAEKAIKFWTDAIATKVVVHTIPVPEHMTVGQAWTEIALFDGLAEYDASDPRFTDCSWANIQTRGPVDSLDFDILDAEGNVIVDD